MAVLYKPNGEMCKVTPINGKSFTLKELQGYVGGYVEMLALNQNMMACFNEEGRLNELLPNRMATAIVDLLRPVPLGASWDLCGNVLIGDNAEFGEEDEDEIYEETKIVLEPDEMFRITDWPEDIEEE